MGGSLKFGDQEIRVKSKFDAEGKILIRDSPMSTIGIVPNMPVYWEGWAWEEKLNPWFDPETRLTKPGWINPGPWIRADVLATSFNERFRWYEVPPHHVVKAIILEKDDLYIMKIVTREAKRKERTVTGNASDNGIIEYARFTKTGPQRAYFMTSPSKNLEEDVMPF